MLTKSFIYISTDRKVARWLDSGGDMVTLRATKPVLFKEFFLFTEPAVIPGTKDTLGATLYDLTFFSDDFWVSAKFTAERTKLRTDTEQSAFFGDGMVHLPSLVVSGSLIGFRTLEIDGSLTFLRGEVERLDCRTLGHAPNEPAIQTLFEFAHLKSLRVRGIGAPDLPNVVSRIARIVIAGSVVGTSEVGGHYGFVAEQIDALLIGGERYPLRKGRTSEYFLLCETGDVAVREV